MTYAAPVHQWHAEHVYFKRLLERLQKELDAFATGERPNYELMVDILAYLREFCDRVHHPREDAAFARLVRRIPDMQLPLARLQQEHRVIAHAGETLRERLSAVVDGAMVPRAEVEAVAATYLVYYFNHIAREEHEVLQRAAAALTQSDWESVLGAVPQLDDPLFGPRPEERFGELRRRIALESQGGRI
jgi:hemerythrin-like domain-containing protein